MWIQTTTKHDYHAYYYACHSPCLIGPKLSNRHYSLSCCLSHDRNKDPGDHVGELTDMSHPHHFLTLTTSQGHEHSATPSFPLPHTSPCATSMWPHDNCNPLFSISKMMHTMLVCTSSCVGIIPTQQGQSQRSNTTALIQAMMTRQSPTKAMIRQPLSPCGAKTWVQAPARQQCNTITQ